MSGDFNNTMDSQSANDKDVLDILVAEDDSTNRLVIESMLKKFNCNCTIMPNGHSAIDAASKKRYDIILMDIEMPDMSGFEATTQIRNSSSPCRNSPIIALTAHTISEQQHEGTACGMTDYLAKPIRLELLRKVIERHRAPTE